LEEKKVNVENQVLYLLSKARQIDGKDFLQIFGEMGYTQQTIRNTLSKLKKEKLIESPARSVYTNTPTGNASVSSLYSKPNFYIKVWDEKWYMVMMEIPETERKKRDLFRRKLINLGFGALYKSIYIYPWDITSEVIDLIDSLEIEEYVTISVIEKFLLNPIRNAGARGANEAARIWDLEQSNDTYRQKYNWFTTEFEPQLQVLLGQNQNEPLKVFIRYMEISEAIVEVLSLDPMLPPQFLPSDWLGTKVLAAFKEAQLALASQIPAHSFYHQFTQQ
jgi:phenylacetic acid degradation operon negative regulatory protein